ncbi:MAG: hypothetical protein AB1758_25310, partial [Candidatus Eremiobacterota bacterium]
DAFYGSRQPGRLPQAALAAALSGLEQVGVFSDSQGEAIGAYGAYNFLTGDSHAWTELRYKQGNTTCNLSNPEDALFLACASGVGDEKALKAPEEATALIRLEQAGYRFRMGSSAGFGALDVYRAFRNGNSGTVSVQFQKSDLLTLDRARLSEALREADARKRSYEALEAVAQKATPALWAEYLKRQDSLPWSDHLAAVTRLVQSGADNPQAAYAAVLRQAGATLPVQDAMDALERLDKKDGKLAGEVVDHLAGLVGPSSPEERRSRYLAFLEACQSPAAAREAVELSMKDTDDPEEARSRERYLLELLDGTPGDQALKAYRFAIEKVPSERRADFARVFRAHPQQASAEPAWAEVSKEPGGTEGWIRLREALVARQGDPSKVKQEDVSREATRLLASLRASHAPTSGAEASNLARVLGASRAPVAEVEKMFAQIRSEKDPETLVRLFEVSSSMEGARSAYLQLIRGGLPGAGRPLEERREALASLIQARGSAPEGIQDYLFVAGLCGEDRDHQEGARLLLVLREAAGSEREARLAMASLAQLGPQASSEAMIQCLKAFGSLGTAREAYRDIEAGGEQGWPARQKALEQTAAVLRTALDATPEDRLALYRRLATSPLEEAATADLAEVVTRMTRPGLKPEGKWGLEEVPGRGKVWSDSPGAKVARGETSLVSDFFRVPRDSACSLEFDASSELYASYDKLLVEVSRDGKDWTILGEVTGKSDWTGKKVSLSRYAGQDVQVRFRCYIREGRNMEGAQLSRVRLTGTRSDLDRSTEWSSDRWERGTDGWRVIPSKNDTRNGTTLVSGPISLAGLKNSRLTFQASWDLPNKDDFATVQVSEDGGRNFREVGTTFKGTSDRVLRGVDLSAYDGKEIRLRFFQKGYGKGICLDDLTVRGSGPTAGTLPELGFGDRPRLGEGRLQSLFEAALQPTGRSERIARLKRLSESVGDAGRAAALLQALDRWPGTDPEEALVTLEARLGIVEGVKALQELQLDARKGERLADLAQLWQAAELTEYRELRGKLA